MVGVFGRCGLKRIGPSSIQIKMVALPSHFQPVPPEKNPQIRRRKRYSARRRWRPCSPTGGICLRSRHQLAAMPVSTVRSRRADSITGCSSLLSSRGLHSRSSTVLQAPLLETLVGLMLVYLLFLSCMFCYAGSVV